MRLISEFEWYKLEPIFREQNWAKPPNGSRIIVQEDEKGEILGFIVLALLPHLEPIWVKPTSRGTGIADELTLVGAEEFQKMGIEHFICTVRNDQSKRLAKDVLGLSKAPGEVWVR